jgi:hypothetical protein
MKIIPVNPITPSPAVEASRSGRQKNASPDFASILARTGPKADTPAAVTPMARSGFTAPVRTLADQDLLASTASLLDELESYQEMLADHRVSLRDLAPGLANIEKLAAHVAELTSDRSEEYLAREHPVKAIAVQVAAAAYQEIARFNSGVYSQG